VLAKPYGLEDFGRVLREVLTAKAPSGQGGNGGAP
jgi:hypothetical protein